ncbi:type I polyketide synthase [Sphaerimonospora sp. CA-214678]|uniref:type I polyketide synthase n=1 Tax=Sphaerimonospora sp. CA-214678 TaxID=3240029 RepID=UPI003D8C2A19
MNSSEPIAIIGMACRFAGGIDSPERFWTLLCERGDTVGELPAERWSRYTSHGREYARALRDVTKHGAFLDDVKGFDADFFDITPREAALMDPQQRIMLELAWEAFEHAGIRPRDLAGTDTGVFIGVGADDYGRGLLEDLPRIEAWTGIGGAHCGVPNRVSYVLDLRGPSIAVDTACSSSLAAMHLAVQALRNGECPMAVAGGVLVVAAPGLSLVLDAAGATAPDGRSKSFDAAADGYGRGEGGGLIVLKRLSDARRDGDRVLAVIRGSAVHQDGRTNGIMAPSGTAQAHLMRRCYEAAGIDPGTVGYVEAHGTGTPVGDPIEAEALASVFGAGRPGERPLLIGSVKPNIGHLEAGAGVAGVIKTVLALWHGEIPPSLLTTGPNPAIPWASAGLRVVTEPTPWPELDGPRRAGVSGYGYGGTIAHVILEQADPAPPRTGPAEAEAERSPASVTLFPLSGGSPDAVRQYADRLAVWLAGHGRLRDVGHTLAHRRTHLAHRAAVVAADREQLIARLRDLAENGTRSATGTAPPATGRGLVWVFSGHGSQWIGMGRELLAADPVFAEVIDRLEPVFREEMDISPRAVILGDTPQPVHVIQPMIFAVQAALGASWQALGVRPDAVIGHSVGEIAAAVTAGILTLEQGARLVCRRSLLLRRVAGRGAMALVALTPDEAGRRLGTRRDVVVAVAASTASAVISGDVAAVEEIGERWGAEGVVTRRVDSDVAFHSPHMDAPAEELAVTAAGLTPSPPRIPVYSTALADPRSGAPRDGGYWAANLRGQVRFAQAVAAAVEDGYRLFVEVSPHPVVEHSVEETLDDLGVVDAYVTHSLRRDRPERETLLGNLGRLYCHGARIDWTALWPGGELADLPVTVWQHRPHWAEAPAGDPASREEHDPAGHTLLGGRITVHGAAPNQVWLTHVDLGSRPYPGRHPVREVEIVPAAVLLNTFLGAASFDGPWADLLDVSLRVPVSMTRPRHVQVVREGGTVRLSSRIVEGAEDTGWVTHTTSAFEPSSGPGPGGGPEALAPEELPPGHVVDRLASLGVAAMGFPWAVETIRRGDGVLVVTVRDGRDPGEAPPATWAPLLDAALSAASVMLPGPPVLRMPAHINRVTLAKLPPARARITVRVTGDDTVDVELADLDGELVGRLSHIRYGTPDGDAGPVAGPRRLVHRLTWHPVDRGDTARQPVVALVGPNRALAARLAAHLDGTRIPHLAAETPEELPDAALDGDHVVLLLPERAAPEQTRGSGLGEAVTRSAWLLARTAQRLAGSGRAAPARLWCVTEGVHEGTDPASLPHGALWGLGRIIAGEHPDLWGGVLDIGDSPKDLPALVEVLRGVRGEDVVVVRDGEPYAARLEHLDGEPSRPPASLRADGTYLVTGGLGALGLEVARWLAERGARRIILAGRRALPDRDTWDTLTDPRVLARVEAVRSLERLGVTVVTAAVDIADAEAAARLLAPPLLGLPPIRGVVHAAGVLDDRVVRDLDERSLRTVLRPKVDGAAVLHDLFPPGDVDFFVLFSSCGQLLGLPGQGAYAAGNAFLDALAAHRRAAGDTGTISFGWTSWRGLGMSTSTEVIDAELAARGTADIGVTEAFAAWEVAERYDLGYAAVLRTVPAGPGGHRPPLLGLLTAADSAVETAAETADLPWSGLDGAELRKYLTEEIARHVAAETRRATGEVDPRRALSEMGLDSVMSSRVRHALQRQFGIALPVTLFWDRPTIDAVAEWLIERLRAAEADRRDEGANVS